MAHDNTLDLDIAGDLQTLGITSLCQWDVMIFLYRHRDSLMGADHLSRLLGYETEAIVATMEELEALGLVRRSRVSQGARFYYFIPSSEAQSHMALERLLAFSRHRTGRVRLSMQLRRDNQTSNEAPQAARQHLTEARRARRHTQLRLQLCNQQKENKWLKAV